MAVSPKIEAGGSAYPAYDGVPTGRPAAWTVQLPNTPTSARLAREVVGQVTGQPDDGRASLVVAELVTNALTHADTAPELTVDWDGSTVRVEVWDDGPGWPELRRVDVTETCGRGVAIVEDVSDRWGVCERRGGKTVWAEITLR